ncbi:MAG: hypothetical protein KAQ85_08900, partial [Thermodesulfovibrionia bacterium]|nr:hypothetical protein [Thermodesulfovibrionia bacterium]
MKSSIIQDRKGFFFTVMIILLIIPLILLVSFYTGTSRTKIDDSVTKMRCDKLHYFVEDIKRDSERALVIFGRRAAIYAIDQVVRTGIPLENYTFNCTGSCDVNCNEFSYGNTGAEAAIVELSLCGTLFG